MKKLFTLSSVLLLLVACSKAPTNPINPSQIKWWEAPLYSGTVVSSGSIASTGSTGSWYDDKEVQQTLKDIDVMLNDLTDSGAKK